MKKTRLEKRIIDLSENDDWFEAKQEWDLISYGDDAVEVAKTQPKGEGFCLCGHAIETHFLIENRHNLNQACVGSVDVKHFGTMSEKLSELYGDKNCVVCKKKIRRDYVLSHPWADRHKKCRGLVAYSNKLCVRCNNPIPLKTLQKGDWVDKCYPCYLKRKIKRETATNRYKKYL